MKHPDTKNNLQEINDSVSRAAVHTKMHGHPKTYKDNIANFLSSSSIKDYCLILTTTNDLQIAEKIASILLELNLAACIQIDNIKSYYRWDNKTIIENEHRLVIKTKSYNYNAIENKILEIHNYALPQIIKINIDYGYQQYLKWIDQNSK
ncbi:probable periplasmic divalent cation tolerance protein CutA [Rickettsia typhi str. Wilmington]|uniref:Periplasmic divalent cation tolerance protein CutA n=2 Tax=Rickettsia typhi TaxID=785 RepID=A0ABM5MTR0_RICTP|nr:probable periplasmic divalent cation tolerance protein CutA [Rickettsia typhi str. Wilmington]AFE54030.1 periplasmic divalent cation tolerance protein CutA [Rickettsia typhi str. TH1527]AFE54869.1 periplasmic divalent cation tolerance protein CutA [Rickettsia typhi str. B9991CWPP]